MSGDLADDRRAEDSAQNVQRASEDVSRDERRAREDTERALWIDMDARVLRELTEVKNRMSEAITRLGRVEAELEVRSRGKRTPRRGENE